jgi:hypothetical protein
MTNEQRRRGHYRGPQFRDSPDAHRAPPPPPWLSPGLVFIRRLGVRNNRSRLPRERQQLGGSIGTALLNTIAASATTGYLASHTSGRPAPQLAQLALIHGYTTVFWWCAGIFAAGAVICGALLRPGPLTGPGDVPARQPSRRAAPARS